MTDDIVTQETSQSLGGIARKEKLSKQRRKEIAQKAARSRWGKKESPAPKSQPTRVTRKATKPMKKASKRRSAPRSNAAAWRQFNTALVTAEKQLVQATADRTEAWAKFCQLSNEIPNLENTVSALRALQTTAAQALPKNPHSPFDLAAILAGQQASFVPPAQSVPATPPPVAYVPPPPPPPTFIPPAPTGYVPPSMANPAPAAQAPATGAQVTEVPMHAPVPQSRASGFALGTTPALDESDDENKFLTGPLAGSKDWH